MADSIPDRRDLRPGADAPPSAPTRSRKRRSPASWARSPSTCSSSPIPTKLEATVRTAFEIARTGRPGPVVIDIPKDVQNWAGEFQGTGTLPMPGYRRRIERAGRPASSTAPSAPSFFEMLGESQRPLIYAGGGVINGDAAAALREFARAFGIPVVTTLMGIGAVDTTHRCRMRMLGMHGAAFANYAVDDCDFLIARRRALRRSRRRRCRRSSRANAQAHRAPRHRSRRDQQGQARRSGATSACCPRRCARSPRTAGAPASSATTRAWHARARGAQAAPRA